MKARFTIERTFANTIELEMGNELIVPGPNYIFENIMRRAKKQYSDLVDAGKEPEIGDQIEVTLIPVCDHCGEEIVGEDETPCFIDGRMVCESCYGILNKFTQREEDLEDAGIDLKEIADIIHRKMIAYNQYSGNPQVKKSMFDQLSAIHQLLETMNITFGWIEKDDHFSLFTLNGKTYTI